MLRGGREKNGRGIGRFLGLKRVLAANVAIFAVVAWGLTGEFMRNRDMQKEIDRLDAQTGQMEKQNLQLQDLGRRFSSDAMLEREARTKLDFQKPGEQVVVVRGVGNKAGANADAAADGGQAPGGDPATNAVKWWHYFFR